METAEVGFRYLPTEELHRLRCLTGDSPRHVSARYALPRRACQALPCRCHELPHPAQSHLPRHDLACLTCHAASGRATPYRNAPSLPRLPGLAASRLDMTKHARPGLAPPAAQLLALTSQQYLASLLPASPERATPARPRQSSPRLIHDSPDHAQPAQPRPDLPSQTLACLHRLNALGHTAPHLAVPLRTFPHLALPAMPRPVSPCHAASSHARLRLALPAPQYLSSPCHTSARLACHDYHAPFAPNPARTDRASPNLPYHAALGLTRPYLSPPRLLRGDSTQRTLDRFR